MTGKLHTIQKIAHLGARRLALVFDDGRVIVADFSRTAERGGVFASLADDAYILKARIGRKGRALMWPGGLDFCADALYLSRSKPAEITTEFMAKLSAPAHRMVGVAEDRARYPAQRKGKG